MDAPAPNLVWEGREIFVTFIPNWSTHVDIAHLEIRCDEPLPITETGYKSHFTNRENIDEYGSAVNFVKKWLEYEAGKSGWKKSEAASNQLSLF